MSSVGCVMPLLFKQNSLKLGVADAPDGFILVYCTSQCANGNGLIGSVAYLTQFLAELLAGAYAQKSVFGAQQGI